MPWQATFYDTIKYTHLNIIQFQSDDISTWLDCVFSKYNENTYWGVNVVWFYELMKAEPFSHTILNEQSLIFIII